MFLIQYSSFKTVFNESSSTNPEWMRFSIKLKSYSLQHSFKVEFRKKTSRVSLCLYGLALLLERYSSYNFTILAGHAWYNKVAHNLEFFELLRVSFSRLQSLTKLWILEWKKIRTSFKNTISYRIWNSCSMIRCYAAGKKRARN